jgi:hypothetical protein
MLGNIPIHHPLPLDDGLLIDAATTSAPRRGGARNVGRGPRGANHVTDDPSNPVALDHAAPERPRYRALLPPSILSGAHLVASMLLAVAWEGYEGPFLEMLTHVMLYPFFVAQDLGWMNGLSNAVILLVLIPLNSVLYGVICAILVFTMRRLR